MRILAEEGEQYLLYLNNSKPGKDIDSESERDNGTSFEISVELPAGDYTGEWIDPLTGKRTKFLITKHGGGEYHFTTPPVGEDLALKITR